MDVIIYCILGIIFSYVVDWKSHSAKNILLFLLFIVGIVCTRMLLYHLEICSIPEKQICEVIYDTEKQFGKNRWILIKAENEERELHFSKVDDSFSTEVKKFIMVDEKFYPLSTEETEKIVIK